MLPTFQYLCVCSSFHTLNLMDMNKFTKYNLWANKV